MTEKKKTAEKVDKERIKERKRKTKIVPKGEVYEINEPNYELMAKAFIDFYHKTKHYLGNETDTNPK